MGSFQSSSIAYDVNLNCKTVVDFFFKLYILAITKSKYQAK